MMAPRLTTRGQTFLAAGVTIVTLGMLFGFPDLTRIGTLLTVLPVLTMAAGWRPPPRLGVSRLPTPALLQPGQRAQVRMELRNDGRGRTLLHLAEERLDPALGPQPRLVLPRMAPGERHTVAYPVSAASRGRYRLGPLALRQQDPFGLTTSGVQLSSTAEVVVLPRVEPLGSRPRGHGMGNEGQIPHMVASHGEDDASIRAYRDGDDLRRVHWPTTAHRGELMVRQEDRPARRRAVLVLDSRRTAHRGAGTRNSFEWAVSALASVAVHLAAEGYAVHLASAETVRDGSAEQVLEIGDVLRRLAVAEPADDDLAPVLRVAHGLTAFGGVVVAAVSDHDEHTLRQVSAIRPPGTVGVLMLLDTDSFAAVPEGAPDRAADLAAVVAPAGWRTQVVQAGTSVRACWEHATVENLQRAAAS